MTLDVFEVVPLGIPQGNQLFHPSNLLTDYLKQTAIMELNRPGIVGDLKL